MVDSRHLSQTNTDKIRLAHSLLTPHLPPDTELTIEQTNGHLIAKYLLHFKYTSQRTGRVITHTAKGDTLPECDGSLIQYYLSQAPRTKTEVGRLFSRVTWLEKRARQDSFLRQGKVSGDNMRVSDSQANEDILTFEEYAP